MYNRDHPAVVNSKNTQTNVLKVKLKSTSPLWLCKPSCAVLMLMIYSHMT